MSEEMRLLLKKSIVNVLFFVIFFGGVTVSWGMSFMKGGWSILFGMAWFFVTMKVITWLVDALGWESKEEEGR